MSENTGETQAPRKRHRKLNSIHKRRGVELNNPGGYADNFDIDVTKAAIEGHGRKVSEVAELFQPHEPQQVQYFPGDMIEIDDIPGVAMIHYIKDDRLGVELEGPTGHTDGVDDDDGQRKMRVPSRCAAFITRDQVTRILPVSAPPRFTCYSHDIYPGDVVMVNRDIGVGIARYVSAHLVGVELNSDSGNSDGEWEGRRYFKVQEKHAIFAQPNLLKKIHPEDLLNKLNLTVEQLNKASARLDG